MAVVGAFTVQELGRVGAAQSERPDGELGETFEWTSDRRPIDPSRGGARAIPLQPWLQGGEQRTVRTDYTGARTPSEQILGPMQSQQTFNGRWDDRYNFPGYAQQEKRRFESMCRRGNLVRFAFAQDTYEGVIVSWQFPYRRDWDIRYQFTVSVHDRTGETDLSRSPDTVKSATEGFDEVNDLVNVLATAAEENLRRIEGQMDSDAVGDSKARLTTIEQARDSVGDTLDLRELSVAEDGGNVVSPFRRLATEFRTAGNGAFGLLGDLISVRSDTDLAVRTALSVLNFEDWSRSARFHGRLVLGSSNENANLMDERTDPDARKFYRPFRGESLYSVSRRFYGSAFSWRLIADRNKLTAFVMTGDELLIIPERGQG